MESRETHDISIHALRKESDQAADHVGHQLHISIHALRKESDAYCGRIMSPCSAFQSTLSVRRATQRILDAGLAMEFQSTLSVRRATQSIMARFGAFDISIHALRKESDPGTGRHQPHRHDFNPRSP